MLLGPEPEVPQWRQARLLSSQTEGDAHLREGGLHPGAGLQGWA